MNNILNNGFLFLINTLFNLYLFILVIRLILAWVKANYFDPITQFVTKLTDFIIKPLRRWIPNINRLETATLVVFLLLETMKFFLILLLSYRMPNIAGLLLLALGDAIKMILDAFFYGILIQVILSWVQPHSPATHLLRQFTSPIMQPVQRFTPPIGGFDISPIPAMILLQLLVILISNPLMNIGMGVAFG